MTSLQIKLNESLFLKDPQTTELGRRIIRHSIQMISELGFETFTFKKLSIDLESTEASIYRYFENKHRILVYLISWYWPWLDYQIENKIQNLKEPRLKLEFALEIICSKPEPDMSFPDIDETALRLIMIAESDKVYRTKQVDDDNKQGLFRGYKSLCEKLGKMVLDINSDYNYPNALISTILEASNQQVFFAHHLPSLTESSQSKDAYRSNFNFIKSLVFKSITPNNG